MSEVGTMRVDATNAEQARVWDGDEGAHWAEHDERYDAAIAPLHRRLLETSAIRADERVLDIGCGNGQTTRAASRAASTGTAFGIDLSAAMIARARARAREQAITNVRFEQGDAQVYPFEAGAFDVAISRTGAMFFGDPIAAFQNIGRALRGGGRIVLLSWQEMGGNEWIMKIREAFAAGRDLPMPPPGSPGPFGLADPARVRHILTEAGFESVDLEGVSEPMIFGADAADAFGFVSGAMGWMLEGLDDAGLARALDASKTTLAEHDTGSGVLFDSAAWLIRARRS